MNDVVLYSGGLDSFLVHHYLKKNDIDHRLLYFDLGGKYSNNEISLFQSDKFISTLNQNVEISKCLNMGSLEHEDAYIPNRNIVATIMAHSICNCDNIWIGGTLSDRVNDNNREVFLHISNLLSKVHNKKITVTSPFWDDHKCALIKYFVDNNGWGLYNNRIDVQQSLINCTFSCYYPDEEKTVTAIIDNNTQYKYTTRECMKCPACFRKAMSLLAGGIFVPLKFTAQALINKYNEEAIRYINDADNDRVMLPRMLATIRYEEKFRQAMDQNL